MNARPALSDAEQVELQRQLDALPPSLEPLDTGTLDGYLCGVLLQPRPVPEARWLAHVHDVDGRPAPPGIDLAPLQALVRRRYAELDQAIESRRWFDPWIWELEAGATPSETVLPWAAGFATALALFPDLMQRHEAPAREALALVFRHLPPDELDDADDLLAEIETLEPPADTTEAVEELVRATLLIADVTRPRRARAAGGRSGKSRAP
jgi:uncharacterized protein